VPLGDTANGLRDETSALTQVALLQPDAGALRTHDGRALINKFCAEQRRLGALIASGAASNAAALIAGQKRDIVSRFQIRLSMRRAE